MTNSHARLRSVCCSLLALFALTLLGQAWAGDGPKEKLKDAMKTELLKVLKERGEVYANIDKDLDRVVDNFPQEALEGLTDERINEIAEHWVAAQKKGWEENDAKAKKNAEAGTGAKDSEPKPEKEPEKKKKAKRMTPPRWIWPRKDWPRIDKLMKKLKEQKGYTYERIDASGYNVEKVTLFKERTFWIYRKDDYIVWSDINRRFTAELALYMSRFIKEFPKVFPMPPRGKILAKMVIVVFYKRDQYRKVIGGTIADWSRGVFTPITYATGWPKYTVYSYFYDDDGTTSYDSDPYFWDKQNAKKVEVKKKKETRELSEFDTPANFSNFPYAVLQHESTHAMLTKFVGTSTWRKVQGKYKDMFPIFLHEACATFFQNWDLKQDGKANRKRTAALCNDRWALAKRLKKNDNAEFKLKDYLALVNEGGRPGTWAPDDGGPETAMNYAVAQSFSHFLLTTRKGRKHFRIMMKNIYAGRPVATDRQIKKWQKAWHKHIHEVILAAPEEEGNWVSVHDLKGDKEDDKKDQKKDDQKDKKDKKKK